MQAQTFDKSHYGSHVNIWIAARGAWRRGCKAATWNQAWCGAQLIGAQIHTCADTPPTRQQRETRCCCMLLAADACLRLA